MQAITAAAFVVPHSLRPRVWVAWPLWLPSCGDAQPGPHSTCSAAVEVIIRWCHTAGRIYNRPKSDMSPDRRGPRWLPAVRGRPQWTLGHDHIADAAAMVARSV